jgi:YD repeat-containing protein
MISNCSSILRFANRSSRGAIVLFMGLCFLLNANADTLAKLTIKPEMGERTGFFQLDWQSTPGFVYRLQKSTDLGNNQNWDFVGMHIAESNSTQVEILSRSPAEFYRVAASPEIFSVEPTFVDSVSNSVLYIIGQCLPDDATVVINGFQMTPTVLNSNGLWGTVSLLGMPSGPLTGSLDVIDNGTSNVVASYKLQSGFIYATAPATANPRLLAPPTLPPAAPNAAPSNERLTLNGQGFTSPSSPTGAELKVKEKGNRTKCGNNLRAVNPSTGEFQVEETDFVIPGRGLDFVWTRTYCSRTGTNTAQGQGWDFSYNVKLSQQPDGTVEICMGNGRCDTFYPNGTNGWSRDEYFVQVDDLNGDGMPDVLFADTGKWLFRPFNAADPASGKLGSIVDRNGNTIALSYDLSGRLTTIVDTLGRTNTVTYNPAGLVQSVTDFTGRIVSYQYDGNGNLTACISPAVTGTPNGNDFAGGKTNRYTYSSGFLDERLNHNLTTCIDGKGQTSLRINYQTNTDPDSIDFDAVASLQRGIEKRHLWRGMVIAKPGNRYAVTHAIMNDPVGNVTEYFFDSRHRCVRQLDFTGRADPRAPTGPTLNRPILHVRPTDPDFYETLWSWNADSLCTSETSPTGSRTLYVYERDFDPDASPRHKGNLRVLREVGCCGDMDDDGDGVGDFTERSWTFEHDPRFGSDPTAGSNAGNTYYVGSANGGVWKSTDGGSSPYTGTASGGKWKTFRGGGLAYHGSANGGVWKTTDGGSSYYVGTANGGVWKTSNGGHAAGTLPGRTKWPNIVLKKGFTDEGAARAGRSKWENIVLKQGFTASGGGGGAGKYKFPIFKTPKIASGYGGGGSGKVSMGDYGHGAAAGKVNKVEALTIKQSTYVEDTTGASFVTSVIDPRGNITSASYDTNGNCVLVNPDAPRNHLQGAADVLQSLRFGYNSYGQLTSVTNAADADGYRRIDTLSYYTNGPGAGLLRTFTVDAQGPVITVSYEYDALGRLTKLVDPGTNDWLFTYNALDQCVRSQTPMNLTERCATDYFYDANNNLIQTHQELRDEKDKPKPPPSMDGVVILYGHDQADRVVSVEQQVSSSSFVTNRFFYDANDNVTMMQTPLSVSGVDPNNIVTFEYDERDLLYSVTESPGTLDQLVEQFDYTPNGQLAAHRKIGGYGGGTDTATKLYGYDGLGRCVGMTDEMGNDLMCAYDRNDNLVFARIDAELIDSTSSSSANLRYHEWRWVNNTRGQCVQASIAFFDPETQTLIGTGSSVTHFSYAPNGQLVSVTDPKLNTTLYAYDTVGRLSSITDPMTNVVAYGYDTCGNVISVTQTDRSDVSPGSQQFTIVRAFNKLHRLTRCTDNVGNTDDYAYDSQGNLVSHIDPKGVVTFNEYDTLGRKLKVYVDSNADGNMGPGEVGRAFAWDDNDRLTYTTDPNTNSTVYSYDSRNRLTSVTQADGTSCSLVWSPRSNLILREDANGTVISNSFDALDRCIRRDITPGAGVAATTTFEEFSYDGLSRLVRASNNVSLLQFSYDSMGNCVSHIQDGWQMLSAFDDNNDRISMTYPGGGAVTYTYDKLDQVSTVTSLVDGAPPVLVSTFAYDGPGRVGRITCGNNINTRVAWNGMMNPPNASGDFGWQQVSGVNHQVSGSGTVIDRRSSTYDRNQNKILRSQLVPFSPGGEMTTNVFDYDPLNRVHMAIKTKGTGAQRTINYSLDGKGNRDTVTINDNGTILTDIYTRSAALPPGDFQMDQYTDTPFGFQQYDANGNVIWKDNGDLAFIVDSCNRLVSVQSMATGTPEPLVSFSYDALGRRISKTTYLPAPLAPVTVYFIYDGGDIIEMREGGVEVARFFLDGSRSIDDEACIGSHNTGALSNRPILAARGASGQYFYFHCDELGNMLALTDGSGNVIERYDYDDYGAPHFLDANGNALTGSDGLPVTFSPAGNSFLFHGMFWDEEVMFYFGHSQRSLTGPPGYMDPRTGRFIDGRYLLRAGVPVRFEADSTFSGDNPWSLKKEEGGRHTPFHNKYRANDRLKNAGPVNGWPQLMGTGCNFSEYGDYRCNYY